MSKLTFQEPALSDHALLKILSVLQNQANHNQDAISIAVVDIHGNLSAFLKTNHASFTSRTIAINKATTAVGLAMETAQLGKIMAEYHLPASHYGDNRITGFGGGLPIIIDDKIVAGIGVSGLTDEADIAYAQLALSALVD